MACSKDYIEYLTDQIASVGTVETKKMFGEYGVYLDGKFIGLACDNQFFLKITQAGNAFLGEDAVRGFPYPGAGPWFLFDSLDDQDQICEALRLTWDELGYPKKKTGK